MAGFKSARGRSVAVAREAVVLYPEATAPGYRSRARHLGRGVPVATTFRY